MKKTENKQKRGRGWPFFLKKTIFRDTNQTANVKSQFEARLNNKAYLDREDNKCPIQCSKQKKILVQFLKNGQTRPRLIYFGLFKQTIQFLQKIDVKDVHPEYGAEIRTHNLSNMSWHPQPLDQGSRPRFLFF